MTFVNAEYRPIGDDPAKTSALVNEIVVEQHADDAPFLWTIRDRAVSAATFTLKDLARWDERLEAHLDGLRVAGGFGWRLCERGLANEKPGEVFTAAVLAFGGDDPVRVQRVIEAGCATPELERALISALGWLDYRQIEATLGQLLRSDTPEVRRVGIASHAVHRQDVSQALDRAISGSHARLKARALKAAGELGRRDLLPFVCRSISNEEPEVRFHAACAAALLGERTASPQALRAIAFGSSRYAERALSMVLRVLLPEQSLTLYQELKRDSTRHRLAAIAVGVLGDSGRVDELIEFMENKALARVAGQSFSTLTGADLAYLDLEAGAPEGVEAGPNENPADVSVGMDPDDGLPWPDPPKIRAWWQSRRREFKPGHRYFLGQRISTNSLRAALSKGNQGQRRIAAVDLAMLESTRTLFEVRAPANRQSAELRTWTS
jgi:uncharacterized protein (TIGR02270 family)